MNQLFIKKISDYDYEPGKILLEDQRYVLMGADALGTLKRDLIFALGVERTKGFMLRYGWHYGKDVAQKLKTMYPDRSKNEWFHIGPKLHSQTGTANVVPTKIVFDERTEDYYAEGYWTDSYEAEQHIKYFGTSEEPVCYIASGHAGGYITELLGRTAICTEVECKAKGDPQCKWVIKPLEDWEDQVREDMHYYEEQDLGMELDQAYKRIESQKIALQKALKVNEELSRVLVEENKFSEIIQVLGRTLHTGVFLEDKQFNTMERYGVEKDYMIYDFVKKNQRNKPLSKLLSELKTVHLSIPKEYGHPHERLITPILIKDAIHGFISLYKESGTFDESEVLALERAAAVCSIKLLNDRTALEVEHRMIGNIIDELLSEHIEESQLKYRLNLMGYDLNEPNYVMLVDIQFLDTTVISKDTEASRILLQSEIVETVDRYLRNFGEKSIVTMKLDQIFILLPKETMDYTHFNVKDIGGFLVKEIEKKRLDINVSIGVSSVCKELKDYKRGYEEAGKALRISAFQNEPSKVVLFQDLGMFSRMIGSENIHELKEMASQLLSDLLKYDKTTDSELLLTLYQYLENQGNIHQTARTINISVGAVRYRLKRIQEISNINVNDSKDFFEAHLAIQVYLFLGLLEL